MFSEKIFVCVSYCKYMVANVPLGGAILNTRGIIDRIYVKHHITLLQTKYTSFGSCGFEVFFLMLSSVVDLSGLAFCSQNVMHNMLSKERDCRILRSGYDSVIPVAVIESSNMKLCGLSSS